MSISTDSVEQYLHDHIPMTRHLGISVRAWDGESLHLSAPLEPNLNHRQTAFGGSVASVAIMAGWSLVHLRLLERDLECRLVIQTSHMEFLRAVETDFEAVATSPAGESWDRLFAGLERRSAGRIDVASDVLASGELVAEHTGRYVALSR